MLLSQYTHDKKNKLVKTLSLYQADPKFYIQMPDGEQAPVFDFENFPFSIFKDAPLCKKRGKTLDNIQYYDLACSFDIETTTILSEQPFGFMYQWQYCIEDYVFMGKTWEDFMHFNEILSRELELSINKGEKNTDGKSLVCYVFNLQYEWQFMRYFTSPLISYLFTDKYRPLLLHAANGITYRCAYRLTNKSLEAFTKGFPHHKLAGDLDYSKIRVPIATDPKNGLTDLELAYCYNDVKGLSEALRDRFDKDKYNIATIPLTSTGYVRKDTQNSLRHSPTNRKRFLDSKLDEHLYLMCRQAFRGGNTHANAQHVGKVLENVKSWDLSSSYPAWILTQTYPLGPFEKIEDTSDFIRTLNKGVKQWCYLITIRLYDLEYIGKCGVPYIARGKTFLRVCDKKEIVEDNGRIVKAPFAELTLTDIDLLMVLKYYDYSKLEIVEAYRSHRGMLPNDLRKVIMEYYKQKTLLKHSEDPDDVYNYQRNKEMLNAGYGMMVQRIDHLEFEYTPDGEYIQKHTSLQDQLNTFYNSEASCLSYQHGVWITAWARFVLQMGLDLCINPDGSSDLVYCDTDSVKYIGNHEKQFEELNKHLYENAMKHGAIAYNKGGEAFPIGVYDQEKTYTHFKTLRAKAYIYSYDGGKTIKSTISGVSKDIGQKFFTEHGFEIFQNGLSIPVSGKTTAHYNDEKPHYIECKGIKILTAANIALIPAAYSIHIEHTYQDFIDSIQKSMKNILKRS